MFLNFFLLANSFDDNDDDDHNNNNYNGKRSESRKHCVLAIVWRSQKFRPTADPFPGVQYASHQPSDASIPKLLLYASKSHYLSWARPGPSSGESTILNSDRRLDVLLTFIALASVICCLSCEG